MKVVIIDDVPMNVTLIKHLVLKLSDVEVECFTNSQAALAWCLAYDPDLVIVDHMMPKLSGTELVRAFRERYQDTPVLMITASHETQLRHQALDLGVTDFLNKPIDNIEFLARTKNMLALNRSHKHLAHEVHRATVQLVEQEKETILCLTKATEYRDPYTGCHILRVAHYTRHIARCLGLPPVQQEMLLQSALMHDIGKVGISDQILLKPGRLTPDEFDQIKQHSVIGHTVLGRHSSPLFKVAAEIAYTHHEKFDGSGYPRGLAGEHIPLYGRMVAVADVFDALTSNRPYKCGWAVDAAVQLLRDCSGSHFDPACVAAFLTDFDDVLTIRGQFTGAEDENPPIVPDC